MNRAQRRAQHRIAPDTTPRNSASPTGAFAQALAHHQAGRLAEAEALYRHCLHHDPAHAQAHHLLGVLALQTARPDLAVAELRHAAALAPTEADTHVNLGLALHRLARPAEAEASLRTALRLRPGHLAASQNLGSVLLAQGRPAAAAECFHAVRDARPDAAEAHGNLGLALMAQGDAQAAAACFRQAIARAPREAEFHNNLAAALLDCGDAESAAAAARTALAQRPDYAEAHNTRGTALRALDRTAEAIAAFRAAIAARPDFAEAHNNLGAALAEAGDADAAIASATRALALRPDYPAALNNLATALRDAGRLPDSIAAYRRALALQPDYAEAEMNLGMALLAAGDLPAGWAALEARWRTANLRGEQRGFPQPHWRGEPAAGRTLLIHAEQGFGDTLQFCRYAPLAAARGLEVILEVQPPLVRLLRGLPGVTRVVPRGEALPAFDLHCPMLSLPLALGTTLADVPAQVPYLQAEPRAAADWAARLSGVVASTAAPGSAPASANPDAPSPAWPGPTAPPKPLRVGLAWAGNPRAGIAALTAVDRRRSLPPALLAPLLAVPGVRFLSLQKDAGAAGLPIEDDMPEMTDFADTAALVANLDLVISVDTAVAHLAGALGRPVWLLDRFGPCWRWLTGRSDSPWYPTLRIYRQPAPGDWPSVIAAVRAELARAAAAAHADPAAGAAGRPAPPPAPPAGSAPPSAAPSRP
jgi:tetratricopeptide (TPR) repeat protein